MMHSVATSQRLPKSDRAQAVLFGLIELYVQSGKPIGSQTLQENGFEKFSSATIRNYFSRLEQLGFLKQPHTSGGRIPTEKAFRSFTDHLFKQTPNSQAKETDFEPLLKERDIAALIPRAAETLSRLSKCAVFLSVPRFDQDFVQDIKLLLLDPKQVLAVVISDFGAIRTEILHLEQEVDGTLLKKLEKYCDWRLKQQDKVLFANDTQLKLAQRIYSEVMVRHAVGYLHFSAEPIIRSGLSRLLAYPEFSEPLCAAKSLALLENEEQMREVLRAATRQGKLTCWHGDELCPHVLPGTGTTVIAIPYYINQTIAGAIALLGPLRLPYRELFDLLQTFSDRLTEALTGISYKFKIAFRQPVPLNQLIGTELVKTQDILLEDQTRGL